MTSIDTSDRIFPLTRYGRLCIPGTYLVNQIGGLPFRLRDTDLPGGHQHCLGNPTIARLCFGFAAEEWT